MAGNGPIIDWSRVFGSLRPELIERFWEHLMLTVFAVLIGFLISFPLAIWAHRHRKVYGPITAVTGLLYTIPSLALLVLLQQYFGLTTTTALIVLSSYTLLILIRGMVSGLAGVPADSKEAAQGMGYSSRQMLWRVELPLALPVIMAGLRIATVTTIGLVTVTAFIGKGGLGIFILRGFNQFDSTQVMIGGLLSLVLAIVVDVLLVLAERFATPWAGRRSRAVI
jgi:osmoprotectant transport system permease protein